MARRTAGLMITDIIQAISYFSAAGRGPETIAAGGFSMGSFILSLAGAVETRLNSITLVGGGNPNGADSCWEKSLAFLRMERSQPSRGRERAA
jgi:dienelactone hydrolase